MSLTLDQLKEKAAQIENEEMNGAPELHDEVVEDPMEELKPEEPAEDPKEEPKEEPTEDPAEQLLDEDGNPIEQEFSFDPNIKVMDNDVQVPDFLAKSVTNEEEAKALTEMIQKSYGLDAVKEKRDHFKTKATELEEKYNAVHEENTTVSKNIDFLNTLIKNNDMQSFQQATNITDDQILKRAADIIEYRELTPQQKAQYDNNIQSRQRQYSMEQENQQLRQAAEHREVETTRAELNSVITNSGYQQVAEEFDSRLGAGAFEREIAQRAMLVQQNTGTILSPTEAFEQTVKVLGLSPSQSNDPIQTTQQPAQQQVSQTRSPENTVVVSKKPTMLKVDGGSKSPARPRVKSIDDLRKLAEQHAHG